MKNKFWNWAEMEKLRAIVWAKQIVIGALDKAYQELKPRESW